MTAADLVRRERSRLAAALAVRGAAAGLAVAALVVAAAALALGEARWITRPAAPLLAWGAVAALAAAAAWWTTRAVRRQASAARVAAEIERERALRAGSLRGALEVAESGPLGRRSAEMLARRLGAEPGALAPALQRRSWRRGLVAGVAAVAALAALGAARGVSPDGWRAISHPVQALTGELLAPIRFHEPPASVLRGERIELAIVAPERRRLTLAMRTTGAPWRAESLAVENGLAVARVGPLDADLTLVASDGRSRSDTLVVRVADRPFLGDVAIRADFPAYLGRAPEVVPVGEPLRVPQGTVLAIRGRASTALRRVGLARSGDTLRLAPDGHAFGGSIPATTGHWSWWAAGAQGPIADLPAPLEMTVVPDSAPLVELLAPERDTVVLSGERIVLSIAASDDHGLASVGVRSWRRTREGRSMPAVTQPLESGAGAQWSGDVPLDLAARELAPGDELHVVAQATDASPWRQTGVSRELVLRVPSMDERREMARALADSATAHAGEAARAQKRLEQRTGEAARSRGQRQAASGSGADEDRPREAMSFEQAERTRGLAQDQEQIKQQVEKLQREARQLEQQLRAAGALDSSLARQLQEVQRLLGEALTPELAQQLQQLQGAAKMSPQDARRSLQQLAEMQKRLREQLERSAQMLQRAALEGAMQTLRDDARELAQRERAFADSLAGSRDTPTDAGRELSDRSRELAEEIAKLKQRLEKERAESAPSRLQEAARNADESAEAMRRAAQQGDRPESPLTKEGAKVGARAEQERRGERQAGEQAGEQRMAEQGAQQQGAQQQGAQQQGAQQQGAQPRGAQRQDGGQAPGERNAADAAREGADRMEEAAQQLADARESQIAEWKRDLTGELDRSIQETLQLARQQQQLAEKARAGESPQEMRGEQSAVQQGTQRVGERLQQQAGKSAHVSSQAQGAMGDAQRKVQEATEQATSSRRGQEAADAMDEAAQALNRAAAALVRDRERAASAQTASGFAEMLQRMQEAAKQQGQINAQAAGLLPMPGGQAAEQARALGARQRALARQLDEAAERDASGRADAMAKEMEQIAGQLEQGRVDASVLDRQQRLFRRLLDAGLSLEKEEREDTGEREAVAATQTETITPTGPARGRDAARWREPSWSELRGLSAEERRAVLEYFRRINAEPAKP